ncbi:MAG TPA: cation diffusion facilitator family transporter [Blastocatellia bacterium]|nr:cation diffusion facilitator family transporter [Blastocatellia bacterium]
MSDEPVTIESPRPAITLAEETEAKKSAARASILVAAFLIVLKTITGFMTSSISVWASLLDSSMDIFASVINYIAVRAASMPADENHTYGHGKAESLAGLFQAIVIAGSGLYLVRVAVMRIIAPVQTRQELLGIATMIVAALLSAALVIKLNRVARRTDSLALRADSVHYVTDIFTNGGVLAALLIVYLTGWIIVDPLISIAIALYILWSALSVGRTSIDVLMDHRLPKEIDDRVASIIRQFEPSGVVGFHDLRTRRSGAVKFIDLHLDVERTMSLEQAHDLTVKVLHAIESDIPRSRVQIHTDPAPVPASRPD